MRTLNERCALMHAEYSVKAIEVRLGVADVRRSAAFYAGVLGFRAGSLWPEEQPQFAILERDGLRLQLSSRAAPPTETARGACTLWLDVAGVLQLHASLKSKVKIEWGPEVYFYRRREFAFKDPDGYMVIVSELTDDPVTCEEN